MTARRKSNGSHTYLLKDAVIETSQHDHPVYTNFSRSVKVRVVLTSGEEVLVSMPVKEIRYRAFHQVYIPRWLFQKINADLRKKFGGQMRAHA